MNILLPKATALLTTAFANAGLDLTKFLAADDPNGLKAAIESGGDSSKVVEAAITDLLGAVSVKPVEGQTAAAALKAAFAAKDALISDHAATIALHSAAFAKSGIAPKAADAKKGLQESDITTAIDDRVSLKAAELSAQIGTNPLETKVTNDPKNAAKTATTEKKGVAGLVDIFRTEMSPT